MNARPFGDGLADAVRKYLADNALKQSQLTGAMLADIGQRYFDHYQSQQKAKKNAQSDEEWLAELQADEANRGVDVQGELAKAKFWLKQPANAHRKFTRAFFINWLLKADRIVTEAPKTGARAPVSQDPYQLPSFDWPRIVAQLWPRESYPNRTAYEEMRWQEIPVSTRISIIKAAS